MYVIMIKAKHGFKNLSILFTQMHTYVWRFIFRMHVLDFTLLIFFYVSFLFLYNALTCKFYAIFVRGGNKYVKFDNFIATE